jgi:hypothetical protein
VSSNPSEIVWSVAGSGEGQEKQEGLSEPSFQGEMRYADLCVCVCVCV